MTPADYRRARIAILQLEHQYCHRLDNVTSAAVGRLFHPEARLVLAFTPRARVYRGREALEAWYREVHKTGRDRAGESLHPRHSIANAAVLFLGPARAEVRADIWAHDVREGGARLYHGYYRDEAVKEDGRWYFLCKRIHLVETHGAGPAGLLAPGTECYR